MFVPVVVVVVVNGGGLFNHRCFCCRSTVYVCVVCACVCSRLNSSCCCFLLLISDFALSLKLIFAVREYFLVNFSERARENCFLIFAFLAQESFC